MTWRDATSSRRSPGSAPSPSGRPAGQLRREQPLADDDQTAALKRKRDKPVQVVDGVIYIARDPGPARVAVRITTGSAVQDASVVARQTRQHARRLPDRGRRHDRTDSRGRRAGARCSTAAQATTAMDLAESAPAAAC